MQISVVVPLFNEEESLPELAAWIAEVMQRNAFSYEVIFVDDGSKDKSWNVLEKLCASNPQFKAIKFRRNYGKSAALNEAFKAAHGDVVITMDADLQDSPDEIPELYDMVANQGYDLVSGWKKKRHDPIMKTVPSKFFNAVTRTMSGIKLHDFNCGLKAYKHDVVKTVDVQGEMHRYIPVISKWAGFSNITEKVVQHRERKYGTSKFGWERFVNGFLDLLSIMFIARFGKRPMHLFGSLGLLCFFFGFVVLIYLSVLKIGYGVVRITERPLFYFGIVTVIVGVQLFLTGFIAELISRTTADKQVYQVSDRLNIKS